MSSPAPAPPRPRRALRWLKRVLITVLVLANLGVAAVYWRLRSLESAVDRTVRTITDVVPELTPTVPGKDEPIVFLVIGSDSREGIGDLSNFGDFEGQRADVIMLVQVHPGEDRAQILSLPRDLWVEIPGHGKNRINAAYSLGGASLMVSTVKLATGLPVNYYVEVDFVGFQAIVDELGGVEISFPFPARDQKSGLSVDAGTQVLDGATALAYARSRTYQELRDGAWTSVDANDIGRTHRQQQLVLAILARLKRPSSLTEAGSIATSFARHLSVDASFAGSSLIELGFRMRGISGDRIETATLPTTGATIGGASVLLRKDPESAGMLEAFRAGTALVASGGPMRLVVLNGNGVKGSAGHWSEVLEGGGFDVARVADADRDDFETTTVLVRPGELARGQAVVDLLGFGVVEAGNLEEAIDAIVVIGADAAALAAAGPVGG